MKKIVILVLLIMPLLFSSKSYEQWKAGENLKFNEFRSSEQRRFKRMLEAEWKEFELSKAMDRSSQPKIETQPRTDFSLNFLKEAGDQIAQWNHDSIKQLSRLISKWEKGPLTSSPVDNSAENPNEKTDETVVGNKALPFEKEVNSGSKEVKPEGTEVKPEGTEVKPDESEVAQDESDSNLSNIPDSSLNSFQHTTVNTDTKLDFYGEKLLFPFVDEAPIFSSSVSNSSIADFWMQFDQWVPVELFDAFINYSQQFQLNDWGTYRLMLSYCQSQFKNEKTQLLALWSLLMKSGFDVRVAFNDKDIYLMMPFEHRVYGVPYFTLSSVRYYIYSIEGSASPGSVYCYDGKNTIADQVLSLELNNQPLFHSDSGKRVFSFSYGRKDYQFSLAFHQKIVEFLKDYPQSDMKYHFDGGVSYELRESVLAELAPYLEGKSEAEAANFLLHFVQKGFAYQTDQQQFGIEKWLFPDESVFYGISDCEDRSIFYSWLVENILGLPVIGLDWPGHVGTAVAFSDNIDGDSLIWRDRRYLICDPTYINSNIGMMMPAMRNQQHSVIE